MDAIKRALKDMSMGSDKKVALVTGASGKSIPLPSSLSMVHSMAHDDAFCS